MGDEKRMPIGRRRDIAGEAIEGYAPLQWKTSAGGGHIARLSVTSPGASALRVGIVARNLPAGAQLRFAGGGATLVASGAMALAALEAQGTYWSPVTDGDTQTIEVSLPAGIDPRTVLLSADAASHLAAGPRGRFKTTGQGAAAACNDDIACAAPSNAAIAQVARSVAKLVYTENGVTYLCSGSLISDGDTASHVPYLYTAAHCIGSQAAAASLNSFWFYEAEQCGATVPVRYEQRSGGATLLFANPASDAALLRLRDRAPDGAWFAGWDAGALEAGEHIVALHHPAGDLKKLSSGVALPPTVSSAGSSYATAAWSTGSTEGGSSGSGIFTRVGGEYFLRGGLRGGSASCNSTGHLDDPSNRDYYSRIDLEAGRLRQWLGGASQPDDDYTGTWWNADEPGWGVTMVQDASNRVFATVYTYDNAGQPTWLVLPDARWKGVATLEGAVYRTTGTSLASGYDARKFSIVAVGSAQLDFGGDGSAKLVLTVDGRSVAKKIRRQ